MNVFCAAILELCIIFVRERQSFVSALDLCIDGINWLSCSPLMCFDFSNILSKSNFMANYFGIGAIGVQYLMLATMSWVHAVEVSSIWWVAWLEHLCLRSLKTDSRSLCMSASCQIKVVFFFFSPPIYHKIQDYIARLWYSIAPCLMFEDLFFIFYQ